MQVHIKNAQGSIENQNSKVVRLVIFSDPFPKGYISGTDIKESRRKNPSKTFCEVKYWASIFLADFGNTNSNNNQCALISEDSRI